jgi:hypothetical protein
MPWMASCVISASDKVIYLTSAEKYILTLHSTQFLSLILRVIEHPSDIYSQNMSGHPHGNVLECNISFLTDLR